MHTLISQYSRLRDRSGSIAIALNYELHRPISDHHVAKAVPAGRDGINWKEIFFQDEVVVIAWLGTADYASCTNPDTAHAGTYG